MYAIDSANFLVSDFRWYTDSPLKDEVNELENGDPEIMETYEAYFDKATIVKREVPNVKGMAAMDAVSLLENLGYKVKINGVGTVRSQSINAGDTPKIGTQIELIVSWLF